MKLHRHLQYSPGHESCFARPECSFFCFLKKRDKIFRMENPMDLIPKAFYKYDNMAACISTSCSKT